MKKGWSLESSRLSEFDNLIFQFYVGNLAQTSFTLKKLSFFQGILLKRVKFPHKKKNSSFLSKR